MRRVVFGSLACLAVVIGGSAFAGDTTPSTSAHVREANEQVAKPKKRHSAAPLSAAAAYKATQADLPATPLHARTSPAATEKPWTGGYVGINGGAAK